MKTQDHDECHPHCRVSVKKNAKAGKIFGRRRLLQLPNRAGSKTGEKLERRG